MIWIIIQRKRNRKSKRKHCKRWDWSFNEEQQDNLEQPENDENVENLNAYSTSIPESFANAHPFESTRINAIVALDVLEPDAAGLNVTTNSKETQQIEAENGNLRELNNNETADEREALRQREIDENVENLLLYGQRVAVDGLEYVHIPGQELKAIEYEPKYEVKSNDLLCGNMPFKLQFNGDSEFMAVKGDSYEEVKLKGKAAEGLVKMNEEKLGEKHDLRFLKGLMIGFLSVQKIKEFVTSEDIGEAILILIKGNYLFIIVYDIKFLRLILFSFISQFSDLFDWRVSGHEARLHGFGSLITNAISDIKINKFK